MASTKASAATTRPAGTSHSASAPRNRLIAQLEDDHERVIKACRKFQKIDPGEDPQARAAIVEEVCDELIVHSALEEELLYPAARGVLADPALIDEAEVEHESLHQLIDQLRDMSEDDEKFAARFTVLCEYVQHHVKEEEGEIFPRLARAELDWESLAAKIDERRRQLTEVEAGN